MKRKLFPRLSHYLSDKIDNRSRPPFWNGQIWYTHQGGFVIKHENMGEVDSKEDSSFCWRPGYDRPDM